MFTTQTNFPFKLNFEVSIHPSCQNLPILPCLLEVKQTDPELIEPNLTQIKTVSNIITFFVVIINAVGRSSATNTQSTNPDRLNRLLTLCLAGKRLCFSDGSNDIVIFKYPES